MIITIDGPSGAGKSTIAKELASRLGFEYLDTGAMYRTITLYLIENEIDINNQAEVDALIKSKDFINNFNLNQLDGKFYLNGNDVTDKIRRPVINNNVSKVSSYKCIRDLLVNEQRRISENRDIILDGRDIGSVVFPKAEYKFYLTASVEARAKRRFLQDQSSTFEEVIESIKNRDFIDSNREISPLIIPKDAHVVDSTSMGIEETLKVIIDIIKGDQSAI